MEGKIIHLPITRRSEQRCEQTGVVFPQLYRTSGFMWKFRSGVTSLNGMIKSYDDLEPDPEHPISPLYTLGDKGTDHIALPKSEPIAHLSENVDSGWVFIRHHDSKDLLSAFLDGAQDSDREWSLDDLLIFETDLGLFTVQHRSATPTCPDHLVIYKTKVMTQFGLMDHTIVIGSNGESLGEDVLMPAEVSQSFEGITNFVNDKLFT